MAYGAIDLHSTQSLLIERWRREYNTVRPDSALGYRPPAPEAIMPATVRFEARVCRLIDDAHATAAELGDDRVGAEPCADAERH